MGGEIAQKPGLCQQRIKRGTCEPRGMFPGVKTPGYSQDVPPGQRNLVAAFSGKEATRFTSDALRASVSSNLIFGVVGLNHLLIPGNLSRLYVGCYETKAFTSTGARSKPFAAMSCCGLNRPSAAIKRSGTTSSRPL